MTGYSHRTEEQLRDTLGALAAEVRPIPDAYHRVYAGWRRREQKRRLVLAILIASIFAAADGVGLWVLNHSNADTHVIFSDSPPAHHDPLGRIGQP